MGLRLLLVGYLRQSLPSLNAVQVQGDIVGKNVFLLE